MIGQRQEDGSAGNVGYATYRDWRDRARTFAAMAAMRSWNPTLTEDGEPERLSGARVSATYFGMLGVQPALGRDFRADEDRPDEWRVVLISDALWRRRFRADPAIIGRSISLNSTPFLVAGVMPASFEPLISAHVYGEGAQIWAPMGYDVSLPYACRSCGHLVAFGRLAAGSRPAAAVADLDVVQRSLRREYPRAYTEAGMAVIPLHDVLVGQVRPALRVLTAAVAFVLLIAGVNAAHLLLARAMDRRQEIAIREALGASRGRIVRQLLAESLVLAALGGAAGLALATWGVAALVHLAPAAIPRLDQVGIDATVLGFTLAVSLATGVLFGIVPAARTARWSVHDVLRPSARTIAGGSHRRASSSLIVADVALALVLLAGAGLMIRSVGRLLHVDPGFDAANVLTASMSLVGSAYERDEQVVAATSRILERIEALPGVADAALASQIPLGGNMDMAGLHIEGRVLQNPADAPSAERYDVTPDYLRVMGIPLRRGRFLAETDRVGSPLVVVIGETTARTLWPHDDPIGQRVHVGDETSPLRTVVGVVGDVRHYELGRPPTMQMYLPHAQVADAFLVAVVRARHAPRALSNAVRRAVASVAADVPVYRVATLEELEARSLAGRRFTMRLLAVFAAIAVLLAAVGIYGVISYSVAQRTRELGVRVALGAQQGDIFRLVLQGGMRPALGGIAVGLTVAFWLTRFLRGLLYDVTPVDPLTFTCVVVLLLVITIVAHWLPARRALGVDPVVALRAE
jgi:putative ABC transport system permease protein